jgi:hypothetical protein
MSALFIGVAGTANPRRDRFFTPFTPISRFFHAAVGGL